MTSKLRYAAVFQMMNGAIYWTNHHPADKYYGKNCAIQWIEFYPPESVVLFLTTGGLDYRKALRYGKTGNKKRATRFASLLQN